MGEIKDLWNKTYAYIIPTLLVICYIILICYKLICQQGKLIQDSVHTDMMLEGYIMFTSIVLSVFAFLMPMFISSKNITKEYFQEKADLKVFYNALKRVVLTGIVSVLLSCVLYLNDILNEYLLNILYCVWIWIDLNFVLLSYRYISILIRVVFGNEKKRKQHIVNKASEECLKTIDNNIKDINE